MWEDLGTHLRAAPLTLKEFRAYFRRGPASLRDIQITSIKILDHLGNDIPVPIMFCSSWGVCLFVAPYIGFGSLIALG